MSSPAHPAFRLSDQAAQLQGHRPVRHTPRTATLRLIGTRQGCAEARGFTDRTLDGWALDHCRDDALTVVTELATNAVVHTQPHIPTEEADAVDLWLRLTLRPTHLVCAVTDHGNGLPVYASAGDPLREHGRGLRIVDALSEHWGWTRRFPTGKTVWAMLPVRSHS